MTFILSAISVPERLQQLHLQFNKGEWLTFVGTNGSGKSTLARIIAGLSVEDMSGEMMRGFAGDWPAPYVMQHPQGQLFGETPYEEVNFALSWLGVAPEERSTYAKQILQQLQLTTLAHQPWDRLSGGQIQRAAIVAAMAVPAPLLILDEATAMLDDEARNRVYELARNRQASGTTVIWVTQRLDEIEPAMRVIALHKGSIIFDGDGRTFMYGQHSGGQTPCEQCGLQPPYLVQVAKQLRAQQVMQDPLPLTASEWQQQMGEWQ